MRRSNVGRCHCVILAAIVFSVSAIAHGQDPALHEVTLFSRASHKEPGLNKSAYNFYAMARSDNFPETVKGRTHLVYGGVNLNGDSDWFSTSAGGPELTRIKDLGQKQWSEVVATPFVPVTPHTTEAIRFSPSEPYEESSEGRITKVAPGHIYVIHIKSPKEDYYVMLRVEKLVQSDQCTISWRVVPRPEQSWK